MHRFPLSPTPWWCLGLALLVGVVACEKKDKPPVSDAPPPAASSGAPADPKMAKAIEEIIAYKARVDKDPSDVEALAAMGNANMSLGRFDHAKDWYERALKIDPNRTATRMDLAVALRYLGKPDEAIVELKRVLAKEPKNAGALYNLGVVLLEDKQDAKGAIARWETLMKAHPDHPQTAQLRQMVEQIKHPTPPPPSPPGG